MTEMKFSCSQCGQHIQCDESYSGVQIDCPKCKQPLFVPAAATRRKTIAAPVSELALQKPKPLMSAGIIVTLIFATCAVIFLGVRMITDSDGVSAGLAIALERPKKEQQAAADKRAPVVQILSTNAIREQATGTPQINQQRPQTSATANQNLKTMRLCFNKVRVRLDKVINEPMNFDGDEGRMNLEENRLRSFANSAKAEIEDILSELDNGEVSAKPVHDLVDAFFQTYNYKITVDKSAIFYIYIVEKKAETAKMNVLSFKANEKLKKIKKEFDVSE